MAGNLNGETRTAVLLVLWTKHGGAEAKMYQPQSRHKYKSWSAGWPTSRPAFP